MTPRETKLAAALNANAAVRAQAERLIAAYVAPDSNRTAIINDLIAHFDGPQQREAKRLAAEALDEASEGLRESGDELGGFSQPRPRRQP
jgi:hypothetical protein